MTMNELLYLGEPKFNKQLHFLKRTVIPEVWDHEYAWPFHRPVAWQKLGIPEYPKIIRNPMDLGTIRRKLRNDLYTSYHECVQDFNTMINNCYFFNHVNDDVYQMATQIECLFLKKLAQMPREDPAPKDAHEKVPLFPKSLPPHNKKKGVKRVAGPATPDLKIPKRKYRKALTPRLRAAAFELTAAERKQVPEAPTPRARGEGGWRSGGNASQMQFLEKVVIRALLNHPRSWAFRAPTPSAKANVRTSRGDSGDGQGTVDLEHIQQRLQRKVYSTPRQCIADVRGVFRNAYQNNSPRSDLVRYARILEKNFEDKLAEMPTEDDACFRPPAKLVKVVKVVKVEKPAGPPRLRARLTATPVWKPVMASSERSYTPRISPLPSHPPSWRTTSGARRNVFIANPSLTSPESDGTSASRPSSSCNPSRSGSKLKKRVKGKVAEKPMWARPTSIVIRDSDDDETYVPDPEELRSSASSGSSDSDEEFKPPRGGKTPTQRKRRASSPRSRATFDPKERSGQDDPPAPGYVLSVRGRWVPASSPTGSGVTKAVSSKADKNQPASTERLGNFSTQMEYCKYVMSSLLSKENVALTSPFMKPRGAGSRDSASRDPEGRLFLDEIQARLKAGQYRTPEELALAMRRVFVQCYRSNNDGSTVVEKASKLQIIFEIQLARMPADLPMTSDSHSRH